MPIPLLYFALGASDGAPPNDLSILHRWTTPALPLSQGDICHGMAVYRMPVVQGQRGQRHYRHRGQANKKGREVTRWAWQIPPSGRLHIIFDTAAGTQYVVRSGTIRSDGAKGHVAIVEGFWIFARSFVQISKLANEYACAALDAAREDRRNEEFLIKSRCGEIVNQ